MKIAVFGVGGVGGFVGGALAKVHPDTFFYVRGKNLEAIRQNGLRVCSPLLGDFVAHPRLATDQAQEIGVMDVIILACKGCHLEEACRAIRPMVGAHTIVLTLLNGVLVTDLIAPLLPPCIPVDGVIRVSSRLAEPGQILHENASCSMTFGLKDGGTLARLDELSHLLGCAGIQAGVSSHIQLDCWSKYASMSSNSVVYLYYDGPAGTVRQHAGYQTVLREVIASLIRIAEATGTKLPDTLAEQYLAAFEQLPPETTTSLYRDLKSGKPPEHTELHHIIGRIAAWGRETGVPVPYHQAVCDQYAAST